MNEGKTQYCVNCEKTAKENETLSRLCAGFTNAIETQRLEILRHIKDVNRYRDALKKIYGVVEFTANLEIERICEEVLKSE